MGREWICIVIPTIDSLNKLFYIHWQDNNKTIEMDQKNLLRLRNSIISGDAIESQWYDKLMEVIKLFYTDIGCVHEYLQKYSSFWAKEVGVNIEHDEDATQINCQACPNCNEEYKQYRKPVKKLGMSNFLHHTFLESNTNALTMRDTVNALRDYTDVGKVVYGRSTSKPWKIVYLETTIMQMVASKILVVERLDDENAASNEESSSSSSFKILLKLGYSIGANGLKVASYLVDANWIGIDLLNEL